MTDDLEKRWEGVEDRDRLSYRRQSKEGRALDRFLYRLPLVAIALEHARLYPPPDPPLFNGAPALQWARYALGDSVRDLQRWLEDDAS